MILQCTACNARYLVPDSAIGKIGRTVRCAKCAHSWFQEPALDTTDQALAEFDKMLSDINTRPIPAGSNLPVVKRKPASLSIKAATGALGLVAATLLLMLVKPGLFGFAPSTPYKMSDIDMRKSMGEKYPFYEINGKIINTSKDTVTLPVLRVMLIDSEGAALQYWEFSEKGKTLEGGAVLPFATGPLEVRMSQATKFVIDLGNPMELALRSNTP